MHRPFFDAIFVVNLRKRTDRWRSIVSEMRQSALLSPAFDGESLQSSDGARLATTTTQANKNASMFHDDVVTRVEAYDGTLFTRAALERSQLLSPMGLERLHSLPQSERIWGMDLSYGAVGCALSHVRIWSETYERNLQRVLVLEDDTVLPHVAVSSTGHDGAGGGFAERVARVWQSVPADWQLVYLSGLDTERQCAHIRVARVAANGDDDGDQQQQLERHICRVPRLYRTTNCYVLNAAGAASLLDRCVPFTFQLDTAMTTQLVDFAAAAAATADGDDATASATPNESIVEMRSHFVNMLPCYCVDPPLAAQATRFGTDIQWESPAGKHDVADEEQSRMRAVGLVV